MSFSNYLVSIVKEIAEVIYNAKPQESLLKNYIPVVATLAGAIVGFGTNYYVSKYNERRNAKKNTIQNATLLWLDLLGICQYIETCRAIMNKNCENNFNIQEIITNINYNSEWQVLLSNCRFLASEYLGFLHTVYSDVYDFHYIYKAMHDRGSYTHAPSVMNEKAEKVFNNLEKKLFFSIKNSELSGRLYDIFEIVFKKTELPGTIAADLFI